MVCPVCTFDQALSNKVHKNLVTKKQPPTTKDRAQPTSAVTLPSLLKKIETTVGANFDLPSKRAPPLGEEGAIVMGSAHKKRILQEYESEFGDGITSIVTKKKGKTSITDYPPPLIRMKAAIGKYYRVQELTLYNVITTLLKEQREDFDRSDIANLRLVNKDFSRMIPKTIRWLKIDFTALRWPRYDYEQQTTICTHRVEMASAALIHFGLDPGKLVRWLGGEYIGERREVQRTLAAVKDHIEIADYLHMQRILLNGSPFELAFDEPLSNKSVMIARGNSKSFNDNPALVLKTMNKEERYSHVLPLDELLCTFSPYCRHTMQTLIIKPGKNDRLCYDATTTRLPTDIVMNQVTPVTNEAPITFGTVKKQFYIDIYNTRISFPNMSILLGTADIKACFRFARVHADLTGAFGFNAGGNYNLATAMVFGSKASASSWEPFRRAIEALSIIYAGRPDLATKHSQYLDMIKWAQTDPSTPPTIAKACQINKGFTGTDNHPRHLPARIYVDDALVLARSKAHMEMVLAALIEAIFVVMGRPDTTVRQCPLAMDKWAELVVGPTQTMLGLTIDTNRMTVAIPAAYVTEVRDIINATWHKNRCTFTVQEAQTLTGKLGHLAEGANWVFHLLTHLYASIAFALAQNRCLLTESSREFRGVVESLRTGSFPCSSKDQARHISFALKKAAKMVHHAKYKFRINTTMRQEIEFFRATLLPDSGITWETPIAHLIPRTPSASSFGDSSLQGAGGYSIELGFWWHIDFPQEVKERTLLFRSDNKDGKLISINVLEFVTVVINYCASLHVITTTKFTDDPYPVLLNVTDNSSSLSWTTGSCKKSKIGRLLARFFCSLLINSPLGINSQWISTTANVIADDISRLKKDSLQHSSHLSFDYSSLTQRYPELSHCSFFQLQPEMLSLIWEIVLTEKWPCPTEIRKLRQRPLGSLTTSCGQGS